MVNISENIHIPQQIVWNFFSSRHGKSKSDGESAAIQSAMEISTGAENITMVTTQECFQFLQSSPLSHLSIQIIQSKDVELERCETPSDMWAIHQIPGVGGDVWYKSLLCYCSHPIGFSHQHNTEQTNGPILRPTEVTQTRKWQGSHLQIVYIGPISISDSLLPVKLYSMSKLQNLTDMTNWWYIIVIISCWLCISDEIILLKNINLFFRWSNISC